MRRRRFRRGWRSPARSGSETMPRVRYAFAPGPVRGAPAPPSDSGSRAQARPRAHRAVGLRTASTTARAGLHPRALQPSTRPSPCRRAADRASRDGRSGGRASSRPCRRRCPSPTASASRTGRLHEGCAARTAARGFARRTSAPSAIESGGFTIRTSAGSMPARTSSSVPKSRPTVMLLRCTC